MSCTDHENALKEGKGKKVRYTHPELDHYRFSRLITSAINGVSSKGNLEGMFRCQTGLSGDGT